MRRLTVIHFTFLLDNLLQTYDKYTFLVNIFSAMSIEDRSLDGIETAGGRVEDRSLDGLETEDTAKVIDASDRQWNTSDLLRLLSMNEGGTSVSGHYMWIDGSSVFTNATQSDHKAFFKTHSIVEFDAIIRKSQQIVILENKFGSVVAINERDDTVIAKSLATPPSHFRNLEQVKRAHPEVLFYKVPREEGSEMFRLKSYLSDKQRFLGFDEFGHPINTGQVQANQPESLFKMI